MNFESAKEICSFIEECSKLGVTKIKVGALEVEIAPIDPNSRTTWEPSRLAVSNAHATEQEGIQQKIEEDHELFMTQLAVDDPEAFEAFAVKGANGG